MHVRQSVHHRGARRALWLLLLAAPASLHAVDDSGTRVRGFVRFDGNPPERQAVDMRRDAKCVEIHGDGTVLDEDLMVGDKGGLGNVFVYVRARFTDQEFSPPTEAAVLDQRGCMYTPRVLGVRTGQELSIVNSDPLTHNVRSFPKRNRPMNLGQPAGTAPRVKIFKMREGGMKVQCDIHRWMSAYVFVMDHPYFGVTDATGAFAIDGLPEGEYTLAAWHERLGDLQQTITVTGEEVMAEFTFETGEE